MAKREVPVRASSNGKRSAHTREIDTPPAQPAGAEAMSASSSLAKLDPLGEHIPRDMCGAANPDEPGRTCALERAHPERIHLDEHGDWGVSDADAAETFEKRLENFRQLVHRFTRDEVHPSSPSGTFRRNEISVFVSGFSDEEMAEMDDRDRSLVEFGRKLTRRGEDGRQVVHPESPSGTIFRSQLKRLIDGE